MSLFGGLNVKAESTPPPLEKRTPVKSSFAFVSQENPSSGFGFLNPTETETVSSGFSFLQQESNFSFMQDDDAKIETNIEENSETEDPKVVVKAVNKKRGPREPGFARRAEEQDSASVTSIDETIASSIDEPIVSSQAEEEPLVKDEQIDQALSDDMNQDPLLSVTTEYLENKVLPSVPRASPPAAEFYHGYSTDLQDVLGAFKRKVNLFETGLVRANAKIATTSESTERAHEEYLSLRKKVESFESEQNAALDSEDFDQADRIQRTIDAINRTIGEVESRKLFLEKQQTENLKERAGVYESQLASIELIRSLLVDCTSKDEELAEEIFKKCNEDYVLEHGRLDKEEELLRVELEGLGGDIVAIESEQKTINEKVDAATVELRQEQLEWQHMIDQVDVEIEEIERQLTVKRDIRNGYLNGLEVVDDGINSARAKYNKRLFDLESRQSSAQAHQSTATLRVEEIESTRTTLEFRKEEAIKKNVLMQSATKELAGQLQVLATVAERLHSDIVEASGTSANVNAKEAKKLGDQAELLRQQIDILSRNVQSLEHESTSKVQVSYGMESKFSTLNEQKKQAVASRNFKEAGKIAAETKSLSAEKETIDIKVVEIKEKLVGMNSDLEAKKEELELCRQRLHSMNEGVEEEQLGALLMRCNQLKIASARVGALGSVEKGTFGGILHGMLESEIEIALDQARDLSKKICGDESLVVLEQVTEVNIEACVEAPEVPIEELQEELIRLESLLDAAVEEEDFDTAAILNLEVESIRESIKLKQIEGIQVNSEYIDPEEIKLRLQQLNNQLQLAVEDDDFETAEVLDTEIKSLSFQLGASVLNEQEEMVDEKKAYVIESDEDEEIEDSLTEPRVLSMEEQVEDLQALEQETEVDAEDQQGIEQETEDVEEQQVIEQENEDVEDQELIEQEIEDDDEEQQIIKQETEKQHVEDQEVIEQDTEQQVLERETDEPHVKEQEEVQCEIEAATEQNEI